MAIVWEKQIDTSSVPLKAIVIEEQSARTKQ